MSISFTMDHINTIFRLQVTMTSIRRYIFTLKNYHGQHFSKSLKKSTMELFNYKDTHNKLKTDCNVH